MLYMSSVDPCNTDFDYRWQPGDTFAIAGDRSSLELFVSFFLQVMSFSLSPFSCQWMGGGGGRLDPGGWTNMLWFS